MRKAIVILATGLLAVSAFADDGVAMPSWMAGAWSLSDGRGGWTEEFWTAPRGGLMIGASREGTGDTLRSWEATRIVRRGDGSLSFVAMPGGAEGVEFALVKQDAGSIEFANPTHDYPQRIRYWLDGKQLKAEISLIDGSRAVSWSYSRDSSAVRQ